MQMQTQVPTQGIKKFSFSCACIFIWVCFQPMWTTCKWKAQVPSVPASTAQHSSEQDGIDIFCYFRRKTCAECEEISCSFLQKFPRIERQNQRVTKECKHIQQIHWCSNTMILKRISKFSPQSSVSKNKW